MFVVMLFSIMKLILKKKIILIDKWFVKWVLCLWNGNIFLF